MQSESTPPLQRPPSLIGAYTVWCYNQLLAWLIPAVTDQAAPPQHDSLYLFQAREQIMTVIMRVGALVGLLSFLFVVPTVVQLGLFELLAGYALVLALVWVLAFARRLNYRLRGGALVACIYLLGVNELIHFGVSVDAHIYLVAFSLFPLLFFGWRAGMRALLLSVATLAVVGWQIVSAGVAPLGAALLEITPAIAASACINFLMVVGAVQAGMYALLHSHELAWRRESQARELLKEERDQLDQHVVARTHELVLARDRALEASRAESAQKAYLAALYQATLDLLNRHDMSDVLQTIVDRSAAVLDAPFGEIMLVEHDELVVHAFTANQPFLHGDRVQRGTAALTWQAFDSRQPAILENYSAWPGQREIYSAARLLAVADFPIVMGERCIGVLAIGRDMPGHVFTPDDIQKGTLFAQLAALVVENARLYDTAVREIDERLKAEQVLELQALELQAQNAELEAFARTVAHDLKSPLTGVLGHSQLLLEVQALLSPQEVDDSLRAIMRASQKMSTIIDALLLLARVRSLESIPCEAFATRNMVVDVVARLQHAITASGATIVAPDSWPLALGYAPWVEEVWANYLSNAIKYGGASPIITLGADPAEAGFVRFWVRDNGPGLSLAQQSQLFTPFTRLHIDLADGQGLGLSIVQRIIEKLGGSVGVESIVGQGSTFYFTLPEA